MRLRKPRQRQRLIKPTSTWILIYLLKNLPRPQCESASSSFQIDEEGQLAWSLPSMPSPLLCSLQLTSDRRDACSLNHAQYKLSNGQVDHAVFIHHLLVSADQRFNMSSKFVRTNQVNVLFQDPHINLKHSYLTITAFVRLLTTLFHLVLF